MFDQNGESWETLAGCQKRKPRKCGVWIANAFLCNLHTTLTEKDFDPQ